MPLTKVLEKLRTAHANGSETMALARLGFLEWLMTLPQDQDLARAARGAISRIQRETDPPAPITALADLMREATMAPATPYRRGGARSRRYIH